MCEHILHDIVNYAGQYEEDFSHVLDKEIDDRILQKLMEIPEGESLDIQLVM